MKNVLLNKANGLKYDTVWRRKRMLDFAARLSAAAMRYDDELSLQDALEISGIDPIKTYPWLCENLFEEGESK